jgi:hypothetical protein
MFEQITPCHGRSGFCFIFFWIWNFLIVEYWTRYAHMRSYDSLFTYAIRTYHNRSCEFEFRSLRSVLDSTLCGKVCEWLATGWWFSPGTPVSSNNKTDRHDITEISLKVALNTINHKPQPYYICTELTVYVSGILNLVN